jgi:hypothetical protein
MADLSYNIVTRRLQGCIDDTQIDGVAVSGGRAGSKLAGAVLESLANNPFATRVKKTAASPGGPLPMALYRLVTHESRKNWIRLVPANPAALGGRAGFAIHGRGDRGSDGCIVPMDFSIVLLVHRLVRAREEAGKSAPTLVVQTVGDVSPFERLHRLA